MHIIEIVNIKISSLAKTEFSGFSVFFRRFSVFFGFFNTDVGIGIGFLKYRDIGIGFRFFAQCH